MIIVNQDAILGQFKVFDSRTLASMNTTDQATIYVYYDYSINVDNNILTGNKPVIKSLSCTVKRATIQMPTYTLSKEEYPMSFSIYSDPNITFVGSSANIYNDSCLFNAGQYISSASISGPYDVSKEVDNPANDFIISNLSAIVRSNNTAAIQFNLGFNDLYYITPNYSSIVVNSTKTVFINRGEESVQIYSGLDDKIIGTSTPSFTLPTDVRLGYNGSPTTVKFHNRNINVQINTQDLGSNGQDSGTGISSFDVTREYKKFSNGTLNQKTYTFKPVGYPILSA